MIINNKDGYEIKYQSSIPINPSVIIVAMHGFAGDKNSSCIQLLENRLIDTSIGLIKFDWPGHGDSEVDGSYLRVDNCIDDLNEVIIYIKSNYPAAKIVAFSTSFGGYLTLLYNSRNPNVFDYIILRSPAIKMYTVLTQSILTSEYIYDLKEKGYFDYGFERNIMVTKEFINDLRDNDLKKIYNNLKLSNVTIFHGTKDDIVPISDSLQFAYKHNCNLIKINGADHRYKKPGELEKVINTTLDILEKNYHFENK